MTQDHSHHKEDRFVVGVDLGGTNLRVAAYCGGTELLETITLPTRLDKGREQVIRDMCDAIHELSAKDFGGRSFAGVGIGAPGPLELPEGILRNPPNLPGWDGFNLRNAIESTLGFGVELESDANVAALAEYKLGAGTTYGVDSLCVLTLGTGVGSGLIFDGKIWHGSTGMGGEAGHVIVQPFDGPECGCGGSGCLEQHASATALLRMGREHFGKRAPASARELAEMARAGDAHALAIFQQSGESLAIALTGLINTLNLPLYLLGGGVCDAWDLFAPSMFNQLRQRSYIYRLTEPPALYPHALEHHKTYVMRAQLGTNAGILGACLLALEITEDRESTMENFIGA